eukprot:CAMPEP_0198126514 /NCGR_PEP_ID=MMETSP1442-20131203/44999_1 /TAXON_ID= /ORGANISM="Craspedostauros australis, Strain CCMP3328" /LENGTH=41 /DNA_ID= /DNA_START= /DNA_END= /DNA_ORIENTATION=
MASTPSSTTEGSPTSATAQHPEPHRGAFIVLEGIDRCGKTT